MQVQKRYYQVDLSKKPLGRSLTEASMIIQGKHRIDYKKNIFQGDYIEFINYLQLPNFSLNKIKSILVRNHTGYRLKEDKFDVQVRRNLKFYYKKMIISSLKKMLPNNSLYRSKVYKLVRFK